MIPYIRRDGELISSVPVKIDTTLYMFALDSDLGALQAMCDRYLNIGGEETYRPLLPMCIFYCSTLNNYPLTDPIGWSPELDFGFWVPVAAGRARGGVWEPERPLAFTPYIWVDGGLAIIGGRSVFGFMKELGRMKMPASTNDPPYFYLETDVIRKFGADSQVERLPLIETGPAASSLWSSLRGFGDLGHDLLQAAVDIVSTRPLAVPTAQMAAAMLRDFGRRVPMVFLKQFPAADDTTKACYQAIVEAPVEITSAVKGGWMKGAFDIRIHRYESHNIAATLGLTGIESDGVITVRPLLHGWTQFEAVVQPGRVVYQA